MLRAKRVRSWDRLRLARTRRGEYDGIRWTAQHGMKRVPMNIASAVAGDGNMVAGGDNWWNASSRSGTFPPFSGQPDQDEAIGLGGTPRSPLAAGYSLNNGSYNAFLWTMAKRARSMRLSATDSVSS